MTAAWQVAGWACFAMALGALGVVRRRVESRFALVAEASHELRGPLAAVQLGLSSLARGAEPEGARQAAALDLELRRAGLALEDLAAAPEGRRAPGRIGPVDVADLLDDAGEAWGSVATALGASVRVESPAEWWVVLADRVRLAQALSNLVANALEHGETPVLLRARRAGTALRLEVVDSGCGLPGGLSFAPRPHSGRRGHGLGIAARAVGACGGRLHSGCGPDGHVMAIVLPLPEDPA